MIGTVGGHIVVRLALIVSGGGRDPGAETGRQNLRRGSAAVVESVSPREIAAGIARETGAGIETVIETGIEIERGETKIKYPTNIFFSAISNLYGSDGC